MRDTASWLSVRKDKSHYEYKCSKCGAKSHYYKSLYCHHCGARMLEGKR